MLRIEKALYALSAWDDVAAQNTLVHSIDPRAKITVTLVCVLITMSYTPYDCSGPLPMLLYPLGMATLGHIPLSLLGRMVLLALPFVLMVGVLNPFLDTIPMPLGAWQVAAGWYSLTSILLRCTLCVSAVSVCVGTTGFMQICAALPRMGVPAIFAHQIHMLYRYLFVLLEEGGRMQRAYTLRSLGQGLTLKNTAPLLGQWLLRTVDRAGRIHRAMCCRGFTGTLPLRTALRLKQRDVLFVLGWMSYFALVRSYNVPHTLGRLLTEWGGL